MSRPTNE